MRLALPFDAAALGDITISVGPITVRPDEPKHWFAQLRTQLPPGGTLQLGRTLDMKTADGWPFRLVEGKVLVDGAVVELRLGAFYSFFEHGAVVIVRAPDLARFEANGQTIVEILERGRPDWTGTPVCLAALWDVESAPRPRVRPLHTTRATLEWMLGELDVLVAAAPTPLAHARRASALLELKRPADAVDACAAALALDDAFAPAHRQLGAARAALGDHAAALASFERAIALAPHDLDARAAAIRALYALGRDADADAARGALRAVWNASRDARDKLVGEYVIDEVEAPLRVQVVEPLRHPSGVQVVLAFHAIEDDRTVASVVVETSEVARAAGTPYVLGIVTRGAYKTLGAARELPPYAQLKRDSVRMLAQALGKSSE